ncbi:MAG: hypothetical protein COV46_08730 [Deltaproteobacteria bacterium CG11_big_fil_rev_8_21_14_0_20_49_13]|nr:MAG: hypothetical protein COV46_08730 [Deltaproteobacteria bacterium CG11_big_fil_rev_8_21_14_0_20_49_13]
MDALLTIIIKRPYIFMFLAAFLFLGRVYWGWRKTFIWLVIGYLVALASEASSIRNGFPYGLYYYRYENMPGELMVFGVPFWDSLSYPFMIFAGYTTARFILGLSSRGECRSDPPSTIECRRLPRPFGARNDILAALLGAFLTMLLDIIIDPLTVMGDRWFLGDIYYYPNGGSYFGVPFTNFAGWFLVPLAVILIFNVIASRAKQSPAQEIASPAARNDTKLTHSRIHALTHFLNPLFYLAIALFNIMITMAIKEPLIASLDCFLLIPVVGLIIWRIKRTSEVRNQKSEV